MKRDDMMTLEDIQDEILHDEEQPSHEALQRWAALYPTHREALTKFFAAWALQLDKTNLPAIDESRVGSCMVSDALNLVHKLRASLAEQSTTEAAPRLCKMISLAGITEDEVMEKCTLDDSLIAKFDRRLIEWSTIPAACVERLANTLRRRSEEIIAALTGGPIGLTAYKSASKPSSKQETFSEALDTSELGEEAKEEWRKVLASEKA